MMKLYQGAFENEGTPFEMADHETYHAFVKITRLFLIIALIAVTFGLIGFPLFFTTPNSHSTRPVLQLEALKNTLHGATYHGTQKDMPYRISAQKAKNVTSEEVRLFKMDSMLKHTDGRDLSVQSAEGLYNNNTKMLALEKDVVFTTSDGYVFESPHALISLSDKRITGDRGLKGKGPMGSLKAEKFEIHDQGNRIILNGPSSLVIGE